jgi:hypothetical protein
MSHRVAIVRTDVSEELSASIISVTRIGELGTTLAQLATDVRCEEMYVWLWRRYVPPKRRFLQESHGVTSQKTAYFIVTPWKPQILLVFLDRSCYIFSSSSSVILSRAWVDPVSDPLLLIKSYSAGNRTRGLWICSQELWPLDDSGGRYLDIFNVNDYFLNASDCWCCVISC